MLKVLWLARPIPSHPAGGLKEQALQQVLLDRLPAVQVLEVVAGDAEALLPPVQDIVRQDVLVGVLQDALEFAPGMKV
jgi:hypothetical protein